MGCDIHLYLEFRLKEKNKDGTKRSWSSLGGRINPGRNYLMFGIMAAGVRATPTFSIKQKGRPKDPAHESRNDDLIYISESKESILGHTVTMARAEESVANGYCEFVNGNNDQPTWITNSDHHSHSWLSTKEFQKVMDFYNNNANPVWTLPEYEAILASMKRLEELGYNARIVFWFDN